MSHIVVVQKRQSKPVSILSGLRMFGALPLLLCVATVSIAVNGAEIFYPTNFVIQKGGAAVLMEDYATMPLSGRGGSISSPTATPNMTDLLSRVTFMKAEPANVPQSAGRFFVVDMNRQLYILNKTNKAFTPYINFQAIFPRILQCGWICRRSESHRVRSGIRQQRHLLHVASGD